VALTPVSDPRAAAVSNKARDTFNLDIFQILASSFTSYSLDPEERRQFGNRVVHQYVSKEYHLSKKMYIPLPKKRLMRVCISLLGAEPPYVL
jgi:hypothetical protein